MSTTFNHKVMGASDSAEKEFREYQLNSSGGTSTDQSVVAWMNGTATNGKFLIEFGRPMNLIMKLN